MALIDYTVRGSGVFARRARLDGDIGPGATVLNFNSFDGVATERAVGTAIKIGNEVMRIDATSANSLTVARGCEDTIPALHADGDVIWFIDSIDKVGTDGVVYAQGETVTVKVVPRSASAGPIPLIAAPLNALTFNRRFDRPYPPGLVRVDSAPFYDTAVLDAATPSITLSWAHRDRVTQADTLVGHLTGSIGPEDGVTYTIDVLDEEDDIRASYTGITGTTFNYSFAQAVVDLGIDGSGTGMHAATLTLRSVRDGLSSLFRYSIRVDVDEAGLDGGWGNNFGFNFGG